MQIEKLSEFSIPDVSLRQCAHQFFWTEAALCCLCMDIFDSVMLCDFFNTPNKSRQTNQSTTRGEDGCRPLAVSHLEAHERRCQAALYTKTRHDATTRVRCVMSEKERLLATDAAVTASVKEKRLEMNKR